MPTQRQTLCRHLEDLRRWCSIKAGDPDLGHDVAQETAVVALTSIGSLRDPRSLRTWLWRIARNRLTDAVRERAHVPLPEDMPAPAVRGPDPKARARLRRAIARLPDHLRLAVRLHYLNGRSLRDVAARLSISRSAVKMRLHRARVRLREDVSR